MPFKIKDVNEPFNNIQSILFETDIDALVAAYNGTGVESGCAVSAQGTPDMTVAVALGAVWVTSTRATVTAGNVTITAAASNPRIDLVVSNSSGVLSATAGTAAAEPVAPDIPASSTLLAMVFVPANATSIQSNYITDKRVVVGFPRIASTETISGTWTFSNLITANGGVTLTNTAVNFDTATVGPYLIKHGTDANALFLALRDNNTYPQLYMSKRGTPTGDIAAKIALFATDINASFVNYEYIHLDAQQNLSGNSDFQWIYTLESSIAGTGSYRSFHLWGFPAVIFDGGNQASPVGNMTVLLLRDTRTTAGTLDSPILMFRGRAYDTANHAADWQVYINPTTNAGVSNLLVRSRIDAAAYGTRLTLGDNGDLTIANNLLLSATGQVQFGTAAELHQWSQDARFLVLRHQTATTRTGLFIIPNGSPASIASQLTLEGLDTNSSTTNLERLQFVANVGDSFSIDSSAAGTGTLRSIRFTTGTTQALRLTTSSIPSVVISSEAALATTATDGFLYIPTMAGAPTGTPTSITGKVPIVFDTTNNRIYAYDTAWLSVTLT